MRITCYLYGVDVVRLKKYVFPETILGVPVIFKVSHEFASQIEVASLRFVRSHTTTSVPKVCTRFVQSKSQWRKDMGNIVMGHLPGRPLRPIWRTLTDAQKHRVFDQTISYVRQTWALPQPQPKGRIEPLCGHI